MFSARGETCAVLSPPPSLFYESGTVSVTVDGDTFTVNFDSAPPSEASLLASQLANLMNYPLSPVVATVSGTKITLNSAINGATANYPLVTSATFVNYCPTGTLKCFMVPAYTANASGTSLTGGTN
jgi:phage tail sheath gpL-like